ncbi:unnamed protein product [Thelazia callipaeda]|uniref:C2H2-type domain-containing protein n=1 Tax=Thelazia callipaeda TaxID=103827 RepID=A0A0N5D7I1_THECL|nr:unnamed protein product [Thelazia callipaeda]
MAQAVLLFVEYLDKTYLGERMLLPCVICDYRIDAEQTGEIVDSGFTTNLLLREHLVECHAKFVARALLAPNEEPVEDIFAPTTLESAIQQESEVESELFADRSSYDSTNQDQQQILFSTSLPNGSKAIRKSTCQVCHVDVCTTARQRHVYQFHLRISNLFQCSLCDYTNNNSVWEMRKHCTTAHQGNAYPVSNEEDHKLEIQSWNQKCFPDWKLKKSPLSRQTTTIKKAKIIADGLQAEEDGNVEGSNYCDEVSKFEIEVGSGECSLRQSAVAAVVDDRTCHLCWEESRYPGRHIAQKHLKKPLYQCPICTVFGSYESCTVSKHINKVHPEHSAALPISNLEQYAQEIRDLQKKCFPNRPMKLVRPHVGNRPRERHICQLCKIQVAQSDRQRHVYHRHLKQQRIFECPLCPFASNYDIHRVKWHIKWMHKEDPNIEPFSHENDYKHIFRDEIDRLNERCFPGWQHRRKQFWWLNASMDKKQNESPEANHQEENELSAEADVRESSSDKQLSEEHTERVEDEWTCMLCKKEFKPSSNFLRHVAKDHLKISLYHCPICKCYGGQDAYEIRCHMQKVHDGCTHEPSSNIEEYADEIQQMYQKCFPSRRLKNLWAEKKANQDGKGLEELKVQCRECGQEMKTEDRQIHVYRHHLKEPRLYECPLCEFSHHACSSDVKAHIKYAHRENAHLAPKANLLKYSKEIAEWNLRCFPGWINRRLPTSALEDFNRCSLTMFFISSFLKCRLCDLEVRQTSRHIAECHLNMSLHECPLCNYGAAESRLVRRHMKNGHRKREVKGMLPIANVVKHRTAFSEMHDQCFPGRPKRLSNITISDEGRRTKCRQCGSTISRKRRLSHLLEKHLEKPMFRCSLCSFQSIHDETAVRIHMREEHKDEEGQIINDLIKYKAEVEMMAKSCFLDWQLRL